MGERKGVTLIEFLIAIAILAIISVVGLLILNPATYMAKRRDAQRVDDLNVLQTAINAYIADHNAAPGRLKTAYRSDCRIWPNGYTNCNTTASDIQKTDGKGWIGCPVSSGCNSSDEGFGSSGKLSDYISQLGIDPKKNSGNNIYLYYNVDGIKYKIDAKLEVNKSLMANDGGVSLTTYEVGTYKNSCSASSSSCSLWEST